VQSYGYEFLNLNDSYEEMGIDFSTDFYNAYHVNVGGAEKYTSYLGKYISDNYDLPDHRDDMLYSEWEEQATAYGAVRNKLKNRLFNTIANAKEAAEQGKYISQASEFDIWSNAVNDPNFTLAIVGDGTSLEQVSYDNKKLLNRLGLSDVYEKDNFVCILSNGSKIKCNDDGQYSCTENIGDFYTPVMCCIDNTNQKCSITYNGVEYSLNNPDGINVVVYDHNFRNVVDSVVLLCVEDGKIEIYR